MKVKGDLEVDFHHTVEDTGIVLGQAIDRALGEKRGLCRYGWALLPMDETLARVAIDLGEDRSSPMKHLPRRGRSGAVSVR